MKGTETQTTRSSYVPRCDHCRAPNNQVTLARFGHWLLCTERSACHRRLVLPHLRVLQGGLEY